jgi:hypothetical protein
VKFVCKLCTNDHLTHLCPNIAATASLLYLPLAMPTNPFAHNQDMALSSSNVGNVVGGSQNQVTQDNDCLCINMVNSQVNVATLSRDYSSS